MLKVGDRIIARGLPLKPHSKTDRMPPAIALVCRVLPEGLIIALRIGGLGAAVRFSHRPRRCLPENVARLATAREVAINMVLGPIT